LKEKPTQLPLLAIRVLCDLQTVCFKKNDVITSAVPTTPLLLLITLLLTSLYIARTKATLFLKSLDIVFMNSVMSSKTTVNYCRIFTDGSKDGNRVAAAVVF